MTMISTPDPTVPPDWNLLLQLIDSKMDVHSAKLDGVQHTLSAMADRFSGHDARLDDHEKRIQISEAVLEARKLQVVEFNVLKGDVDTLKGWKIDETAKDRSWSRHLNFLWMGLTAVIVPTAGWVIEHHRLILPF